MRIPVEVQIWRMAVMFLIGATSNILFQIYTAFRLVFRPKRKVGSFIDFIFGLLLTAGFFAGVFITSWGEVRYYVPIFAGAGALCGYLFTGKTFYILGNRFFARLVHFCKRVRNKILLPLKVKASSLIRSLRKSKPPPPNQ